MAVTRNRGITDMWHYVAEIRAHLCAQYTDNAVLRTIQVHRNIQERLDKHE